MKIATMYFRSSGLARFRISRKHRLHLDLTAGFPPGAVGNAVFMALEGKTVQEARQICASYRLPFRVSEMKDEGHPEKSGKGTAGHAANHRRDAHQPVQSDNREEQPDGAVVSTI